MQPAFPPTSGSSRAKAPITVSDGLLSAKWNLTNQVTEFVLYVWQKKPKSWSILRTRGVWIREMNCSPNAGIDENSYYRQSSIGWWSLFLLVPKKSVNLHLHFTLIHLYVNPQFDGPCYSLHCHCLWWENGRNIVLEIDDKTQLNVLLLAEFLYFFDKYKYSLLRIDMKTKVVQHVTCEIWHVT